MADTIVTLFVWPLEQGKESRTIQIPKEMHESCMRAVGETLLNNGFRKEADKVRDAFWELVATPERKEQSLALNTFIEHPS